eukprot:365189-Chlamydomonas_euryale.AAC.3
MGSGKQRHYKCHVYTTVFSGRNSTSQSPAAPNDVTPILIIAFVDLIKALNREALWEVLKLYGVHLHMINLLEDLHTGEQAVVRVDGEVVRPFPSKAGAARVHTRTYALQCFCFNNNILQEGLSQLPSVKHFGVQIVPKSGGADRSYLSDCGTSVPLSCVPTIWCCKLIHPMIDKDGAHGVFGRPMTLPLFELSGKELLVTENFNYLGSFSADDGSMSREMDVRNVRAPAAFRELQDVWATSKAEHLIVSEKWMRIAHS